MKINGKNRIFFSQLDFKNLRLMSLSVFYFLIIISVETNAQWVLQNPKIQAELLTDIVTADSVTSYCAGYLGRVMKSTDKGDTWKILNTGVKELFIHIYFNNAQSGWALTYNSNKLYKTINGGTSWSFISIIDSPKTISSLLFINDTTGFITGDFNSIIRTNDGGLTWKTINITNSIYSGTSSIFFTDEKNGFVIINSSQLYKTSNSGLNWDKINTFNFSPITSSKLFCIDTSNVFVSGYINLYENSSLGSLMMSNDGCRTWKTINFDKQLQSVYFINSMVGAVIKDWKVLVTKNGGASWTDTQISASTFSFFKDNKTGLVLDGSNLIIE